MTADLVPVQDLGPGLVPAGFAEQMLERTGQIGDARTLYDGAAYLSGLAQKWNGHGAEKREIKAAQMFCEIRLGQLLGPNPGMGSQDSPHAGSSLPTARVAEFRPILEPRPPLMFENGGVPLTGPDRDRWLMGGPVLRTGPTP